MFSCPSRNILSIKVIFCLAILNIQYLNIYRLYSTVYTNAIPYRVIVYILSKHTETKILLSRFGQTIGYKTILAIKEKQPWPLTRLTHSDRFYPCTDLFHVGPSHQLGPKVEVFALGQCHVSHHHVVRILQQTPKTDSPMIRHMTYCFTTRSIKP